MTRTLVHVFRFLFSASLAVALAACAANSDSDVPGGAAAAQPAVAPQVIQNDAGDFDGSIQDSALGNGSASASLAQHAQGIGGYLTATYGSTSITNAVVLQTQTGITITGGEVANTNNGVCTFSMSATYDKNSNVLSGTYTAVHGCSGESGSFSLTKNCYYPRGGLDAVPAWNRTPAQPDHGLRQC